MRLDLLKKIFMAKKDKLNISYLTAILPFPERRESNSLKVTALLCLSKCHYAFWTCRVKAVLLFRKVKIQNPG